MSAEERHRLYAEERYRLYTLRDGSLKLHATAPDGGGIGTALETLDAEAREYNPGGNGLRDDGRIGVLDYIERRWIISPFTRSRT